MPRICISQLLILNFLGLVTFVVQKYVPVWWWFIVLENQKKEKAVTNKIAQTYINVVPLTGGEINVLYRLPCW